MDNIGAAGPPASVDCAASQQVTVPAAKPQLVRGTGEDVRVEVTTERLRQMCISTANAKNEDEIPSINSLSTSDENISKAGSSEEHIKLNANVDCAASQQVTVPAAKPQLVRGTGEDDQVEVATERLHQTCVSTANAKNEDELPGIISLSTSNENISKADSSEKHIKLNGSASEAATPEVGGIAARNISPEEPEHAPVNWIPGGLYACFQDGAYACFKVLAVDEEGLHIRPFLARYEQLPSVQECERLDNLSKRVFQDDEPSVDSLSGDDSPGCQCSGERSFTFVGHMPMARSRFERMNAQLIITASIIDSELEGYRYWQDAEGGYFL